MNETLSRLIEPARPAEWPADAAISRERWENLSVRLIDAMNGGSGVTLAGIYRATGIDGGWVDRFMTSPESLLKVRRSIWEEEKTALETNADKLDSYLVEFALKRSAGGTPRPVETGVTKFFIEVADETRELSQCTLFDGPPGIGKSDAIDACIRRVQLAAGYYAPVWRITLDEYTLSHKAILDEIGRQIVRRNWDNRDVPTMRNSIRDAAVNTGGLLIVDEAQHLADADLKQGVAIINGLRSFADQRFFGVLLIGNGEIYRKINGKPDRVQLFSRLELREVRVGNDGHLTAGDVRTIAESWSVTGVDAYALSWQIAQKPGALRRLTKLYARARREYGEINYDSMIAVGALA